MRTRQQGQNDNQEVIENDVNGPGDIGHSVEVSQSTANVNESLQTSNVVVDDDEDGISLYNPLYTYETFQTSIVRIPVKVLQQPKTNNYIQPQ